MASYNRVILMGNLTRDPQISYTPSNTPVCEFGLAVNRRYRGQDGNQREDTCFVDVSAFGRSGETINQYLSKGQPILIEGRLHYSQWTNPEGQKRSKLTVIAERFQFVGGRGRDEAPPRGENPPPPPAADQPTAANQPEPAPPAWQDQPPQDDDIPF